MTGLPHGWSNVPLGSILREPLRNGHSAKASGSDKGVPTLTLTAVTNGDFSEANIKMTVAEPDKVRALWIQPGDIFVQRSNTPALVGTARLYRGAPDRAVFPDLLIRVRLNDQADPRYVEAFLQSPAARSYFRTKAQGIAGSMPKIDQAAIEAIRIPLAGKAEQLSVVAEIDKQLTRVDAGVAALRRVQANLKLYRASILKAACEGRLVPTEAELARREARDYEPASVLLQRILKERRRLWEESELAKLKAKGKSPADDRWKTKYEQPQPVVADGLPDLPTGWCWATAEALCTGVDSGTTPTAENFGTEEDGVPFLKVYNLTFDGSLDFSNKPTWITEKQHRQAMGRSRVIPGDVLINIVGPPLGKVSVVPSTNAEWNINQAIVRFRACEGLRGGYLALWLQSAASQTWLRRTAKTTTSQVNLAVTTCRRLPIPLPPLVEQDRIQQEVHRRLSFVDGTVRAVHDNIEKAGRLRQSILRAAFEGALTPGFAPAAHPRGTPPRPLGRHAADAAAARTSTHV